MKQRLSYTQIENLIELVQEMKARVKKKNASLTLARQRLRKAKGDVQRLQEIIKHQQKRIVELHLRQP